MYSMHAPPRSRAGGGSRRVFADLHGFAQERPQRTPAHTQTYIHAASQQKARASIARARAAPPAGRLARISARGAGGGGQVSNNDRASKAKQRSKGREAFEQPLLLQQSKAEEERGEADKSLGRFVGQAGGAEKRIAHPTSSCYLPDCAAIIQPPPPQPQ